MSTMTVAAPDKVVSRSVAEVAIIGNPNAGKTSVFNGLTGLRQKIANYPGATVEKKTGILISPAGIQVRIHDLPGLYSLEPQSSDDKIAIDILLNRSADDTAMDLVVVVADATNLDRNLYLVTQVVDLGLPVIVVLNMMDLADANGVELDIAALSRQLGVPIVQTGARKGMGITQLRNKIFETIESGEVLNAVTRFKLPKEVVAAAKPIYDWLKTNHSLEESGLQSEAIRIISSDAVVESWAIHHNRYLSAGAAEMKPLVEKARESLSEKEIPWQMLESSWRYERISRILKKTVHCRGKSEPGFSEKIDRVLTHQVAGPIIFLGIFAIVFQSIFTWAQIPMDAIDALVGWLGQQIAALSIGGILESMIVDGVIAGVGAVLVFLPQILFLFFFLSILENSGYMARVAFILDRIMRFAGLSGRSVIPLLSCFACAVPGIMATRTVPNWRERLTTIMIAPLMSCSARLPVYALMIAAFIPDVRYFGVFSLAGLILLGMYLAGIVGAAGVALIVQRFTKKDSLSQSFVMELPSYRLPSLRWTMLEMYERGKVFVMNAGKIILAISLVLWFLATFPLPDENANLTPRDQIEQSFAGRVGHFIEPAIKPLGFDWKIGIGLITSFAAREVMVSTLATLYNVESADETSLSLREALQNERDPQTGKPVYTPLVAISIMIFFVFACQCMATLAIVKRETNSWFWPTLMVVYMTALAYVASLVVYQGGMLLGLG